MLRLFGGRFDDPEYVGLLGPCTELLWDVALEIVAAGSSVVLDWNFWSRQRRSEARRRAEAAGAHLELHWLDVPVERAVERARARLDEQLGDSHEIDEQEVRQFATIFEAPEDDEGIPIVRHS